MPWTESVPILVLKAQDVFLSEHRHTGRQARHTKIVPRGEWGHLLTLTLTSDDLESHIVVNVSSTSLTNATIWFVAALCFIVDVRTDVHTVGTDGRTYLPGLLGHFSGDDLKSYRCNWSVITLPTAQLPRAWVINLMWLMFVNQNHTCTHQIMINNSSAGRLLFFSNFWLTTVYHRSDTRSDTGHSWWKNNHRG